MLCEPCFLFPPSVAWGGKKDGPIFEIVSVSDFQPGQCGVQDHQLDLDDGAHLALERLPHVPHSPSLRLSRGVLGRSRRPQGQLRVKLVGGPIFHYKLKPMSL